LSFFAQFYVRLIDKICDWCDEATAIADPDSDNVIDSEFNVLHVNCVVNNNFVDHLDTNFHSIKCSDKVHKDIADSVYNNTGIINVLDSPLSVTSVACINSVDVGHVNFNNAPLYSSAQSVLINCNQGCVDSEVSPINNVHFGNSQLGVIENNVCFDNNIFEPKLDYVNNSEI
jgi:hypothetical protein